MDSVTVFVHGYGDFSYGRVDFSKLVRARRRAGYESRFIDLPAAGIISMERNLESFSYQLMQIQEETGAKTIDCIGHSLGGLVIVAFAKLFPGEADRIGKAIVIGAPLRGTKTVNLSIRIPPFSFGALPLYLATETMKQLSHRSEYILALRDLPLPEGPQFSLIAAVNDTFYVRPWHSALWLYGAKKYLVAPWSVKKIKLCEVVDDDESEEEVEVINAHAGHITIVRKQPVVNKVVEILRPSLHAV